MSSEASSIKSSHGKKSKRQPQFTKPTTTYNSLYDTDYSSNLATYLDNNAHLSVSTSKRPLLSIQDITSDDEIFIIHCPKAIDLQQLTAKKIKSVGKKTITEKNDVFDIESIPCTDDVTCSTLLCSNSVAYKTQAISFKPAAIVNIKKRIDEIPATLPSTPAQSEVPYPKNLKVRHPIHGFNYEEIIQLSGKIKQRIGHASRMSVLSSGCSKAKRRGEAPIKIEDSADEETKCVKVEVDEKVSKKRKTVAHLDDEKCSPKKRKNERDSANLDWLASI